MAPRPSSAPAIMAAVGRGKEGGVDGGGEPQGVSFLPELSSCLSQFYVPFVPQN